MKFANKLSVIEKNNSDSTSLSAYVSFDFVFFFFFVFRPSSFRLSVKIMLLGHFAILRNFTYRLRWPIGFASFVCYKNVKNAYKKY